MLRLQTRRIHEQLVQWPQRQGGNPQQGEQKNCRDHNVADVDENGCEHFSSPLLAEGHWKEGAEDHRCAHLHAARSRCSMRAYKTERASPTVINSTATAAPR